MNLAKKVLRTASRMLALVVQGLRTKTVAKRQKDTVIVVSYGRIHGSSFIVHEARRLGFQVISISPSRDLRSQEWWLSIRWNRANTHRSVVSTNLIQKLSKYRILACLTGYKETCVPFVTALTHELGLRGTSTTAATASIDKLLLYQLVDPVDHCGVSVLGSQSGVPFVVNDFPVVVKPRAGTASKGVKVFKTASELASWNSSATYSPDGMLVQPLRSGIQYDIEGISHDGVHFFYGIVWEKYLNRKEATQPAFFFFNPPTQHTLLLEQHASMVLNALSVTNGPWHIEVRVDREQNVHLLDFANRFGGGFWEPISVSTDSAFVGDYVNSMARDAVPNPGRGSKGLVIVYFETNEDGNYWEEQIFRAPDGILAQKTYRRHMKPSFGEFFGFTEIYGGCNRHLLRWFIPLAQSWLKQRDPQFEKEASQLSSPT